MEDVFDRKVHEKEKKLAATEEDLKKKLYESQENLDKQKIDLEAKMANFEKVNELFLIHYFFQCRIIEWFADEKWICKVEPGFSSFFAHPNLCHICEENPCLKTCLKNHFFGSSTYIYTSRH